MEAKHVFYDRIPRAIVTVVMVLLSVVPLTGSLQAQQPATGADVDSQVTGETLTIKAAGVISWQEMLDYEAAHPPMPKSPNVVPYMPAPAPQEMSKADRTAYPGTEAPSAGGLGVLGTPTLQVNFGGLGDNNTVIPPDTMGAAGPNHLMVMLNSQVRIQDKSGTNLGTVTLATFWTGASGLSGSPFDPRLIYDSLSGRWMAVVDVDGNSTTSRVWFAYTSGSDPTGTWSFYEIDADSTNTYWADFPDIGTNSTWIAITNNMFTVAATPAFGGAKMWVIEKSTLGGALTVTTFARGFDTAGGYYGFTLRPCLTFDAAESSLYIVDGNSWQSGGVGLLRLSQITGTGASPSWAVLSGSSVAPGSGWFFTPETYNLVQINADQAGTPIDVATNDPRLLECVFRNGHLWTTHSGGYPRSSTADSTVAVWYELSPSLPSPVVQSGTVGGVAGTHYFFPSIAVNANDDVVLGFSYSDSTQYVEGAFTGRESTDALGTMGSVTTCKAGEDSYVKTFSGTTVRWGDYSATVIDPADDLAFWTLQEYAATDVGGNPNDDRWGTWWCGAQAPTAVNLVSFTAAPAPDGAAIALEWETATEIDNVGFNLYRAGSLDGLRTRLNASLIPSQAPGSPAGAVYAWLDESVTSGMTYYYWLEDVDVHGVATLHGPVTAELAPAFRLLPARPRPAPAPPIVLDR
jgi:hypothetical protein